MVHLSDHGNCGFAIKKTGLSTIFNRLRHLLKLSVNLRDAIRHSGCSISINVLTLSSYCLTKLIQLCKEISNMLFDASITNLPSFTNKFLEFSLLDEVCEFRPVFKVQHVGQTREFFLTLLNNPSYDFKCRKNIKRSSTYSNRLNYLLIQRLVVTLLKQLIYCIILLDGSVNLIFQRLGLIISLL